MHQVTIGGNTLEEFKTEFAKMANTLGFFSVEQLRARAMEKAQEQKTAPAETPPAEKPKRGRPKVEVLPETESPNLLPESDDVGAETTEPTEDDCKNAMRDLATRVSKDACVEVLKKYGVNKPSLVPAEKRAAFIADAAKVKK